jgi:hypothetical protein
VQCRSSSGATTPAVGAASSTAAAFAKRQAMKQVKVGFAYVQNRGTRCGITDLLIRKLYVPSDHRKLSVRARANVNLASYHAVEVVQGMERTPGHRCSVPRGISTWCPHVHGLKVIRLANLWTPDATSVTGRNNSLSAAC